MASYINIFLIAMICVTTLKMTSVTAANGFVYDCCEVMDSHPFIVRTYISIHFTNGGMPVLGVTDFTSVNMKQMNRTDIHQQYCEFKSLINISLLVRETSTSVYTIRSSYY